MLVNYNIAPSPPHNADLSSSKRSTDKDFEASSLFDHPTPRRKPQTHVDHQYFEAMVPTIFVTFQRLFKVLCPNETRTQRRATLYNCHFVTDVVLLKNPKKNKNVHA